MEEQQTKEVIREFVDLILLLRRNLTRPMRIPRLDVSPMQVMVLAAVEAHRSLNMTQISAKLSVSNQQLTKLVDGLVGKGYAARATDPANRRAVLVRVTDTGCALLLRYRDAVVDAVYPALAEIPKERIDALQCSIRQMRNAVDGITL